MTPESTRFLKLFAILSFFGVLMLLPQAAVLAVLMQLVVCGAAVWVLARSFQNHRPALGAAFVLVAAVFNPFLLYGLSRPVFLALATGAFGLFALLVMTEQQQRLSIASITDRTPGSESL